MFSKVTDLWKGITHDPMQQATDVLQGELHTQETFLGLPFSATQTAALLSHRLTCSLSQSPLLESQDLLFFCRAGADITGFPSALHPHQQVGHWAWAHKHQQLWWDHPYTSYRHHQRGPAILFLVPGLIWTRHVTLKLQPKRHLKHSQYISKHTVPEHV